MADDDDQDLDITSCKVVLLGEAGVGKTSIISSFITRKFDENIMTTTGASFAAKSLNIDKYDKDLKFEIWDTAGQEKFRSLTKIFYKDATIAILVYDITRKESFDELVNYWYRQVKDTVTTDLILAVCANKSDLYESEQVNEETAREFAQDVGAIFKSTSAKNALGIDDLFICLGQKYFEPLLEETTGKNANENAKGSGKTGEGDKGKGKNIKLKKGDDYVDKDAMNDKSKCC